jgi:hypothetical protein
LLGGLRSLSAGALATVAAVVVACGSNTSGGAGSPTTAGPDASGDAPNADGAVDSGAACNAVNFQIAPSVTQNCVTTPVVTIPVGGMILDGTYVLTASTLHGSSCPTTPAVVRSVKVVSGASWQEAIETAMGSVIVRTDETVTLASGALHNTLQVTDVCPPQQFSTQIEYDATQTTLVTYESGSPLIVNTWAKQ